MQTQRAAAPVAIAALAVLILASFHFRLAALEAAVTRCNCGHLQPNAPSSQQDSVVSSAERAPRGTGAGGLGQLGDASIPPALRLFGPSPPRRVSLAGASVHTEQARDGYLGMGDGNHLGGAIANDTYGQSPALYAHILKRINVRSVLDVGCGRGISTKWFLDHGADALCIEGSSDTIKQSFMPPERIVQHDFSLGPWWPDKTYDLAWSVEVLEHVSRPFMKNYQAAFHKAALIFVTHAATGGWHHTEVHREDWWINRMEMQGFVYSPSLTRDFREVAKKSRGDGFLAQHLIYHGLVFINPKVSSLYEHAHLMGDPGCYKQATGVFPCGITTPSAVSDKHRLSNGYSEKDALPERFLPTFTSPTKWDSTEFTAPYVPPGTKCKSDYPFPTSHDGCPGF